jgi:hypothetical protein
MCPEKRDANMRRRSGYVYYDEKEKCWIARATVTDENGKRRNVKRRGENKSATKEIGVRACLRGWMVVEYDAVGE